LIESGPGLGLGDLWTGAARPLHDEWGHPAQISHRLK